MKQTIPNEQLRALLENIIREAPPFTYEQPLQESDLRWLARAEALIEAVGVAATKDMLDFRVARQSLGTYSHNRDALMSPLLNCYYRAELHAPPAGQGRFIPPGDTWGGYAALVKLVERPCDDLLIIDPYLDATVFTDILPHARARKATRCLTVRGSHHGALVAAAGRWAKDVEGAPVELRYAPKQTLHDRLVFVDDEAWDISQSLKDLAKRSPASVTRSEPEMGQLKLAHYNEVWEGSAPLVA